ncbi:MAG TPA: ATP-binding protein [Ktedonobacteraceae bacterium]|nr:ATP-binding protein [Ktedonobacteraceae bacterium]
MDEGSAINYRHFFQKLVEAMPSPMLVIDADLRVFHGNQHVQKLLGRTETLEGLRLDQLLDDAAISQLIALSIQSSKVQCGEFSRDRSGETWRVSVTPVEHKKSVRSKRKKQPTDAAEPAYRYFAVVIEDLTELRRLERVRRDFIANISHELRTPLASVRLLTETLEDVIDTDPDKAQGFVEKIENEVQYLSDLVAELLELSRIEAGRVPMNIEPVQAEMLVREVMARMLPQAQRHRVTLRTQIEQGQNMVAADSKQIARVLVNLVHNAIKFTPSGGIIVIGTRQQPGHPRQNFSVKDTGVGIAAEDLPRVFERFYKASQSRARRNFIGPGGGGSGLGLAIARHVVEAHNGRIFATSEQGKGSTFTFTLPLIPSTRDRNNNR